MGKIYINGQEFEARPDKNLLDVSISQGFNLPYFCWHPKLGSVGACRQCAVKKYKDEHDTKGRIVMACMEPATDGARISIDDPEAKDFRKNIIEALMTNHPHDCPVCDEGGECHLQDMTVMSGHNTRRFEFKKRTHRNQNLGPFINHEMNRCIQCYRCVRYYRDYADGDDLNVFASHNHVYFGRSSDGVLENEFSGNLVEVCPTGVFTDKTLKDHYTRKWDFTTAPSICTHCSLGCNTIVAERYGTIRRIYSRYNGQVNGYFLCDRGRFGYEYVNSDLRLKHFLIKEGSSQKQVEKTSALEMVRKAISEGKVIGIGSPRASLEANFALKRLVGAENFSVGISEKELRLNKLGLEILSKGNVRTPSLREVEDSDAVFLLGEDVTQTAPMLALALRQSAKNTPRDKAHKTGIPQWQDSAVKEIVQHDRGPFYIANTSSTRLDDIATARYIDTPDSIAQLGNAVAHFIDEEIDLPKKMGEVQGALAKKIASHLLNAAKPLIVSGIHSMHEGIMKAAANIAWALKKKGKDIGISLTFRQSNSVGLSILDGKSLDEVFESIGKNEKNTAIILENDLYRRMPKTKVDSFLEACHHIISFDHSQHETTLKSTAVLPAGTFAETDGTFVNNEGRAQRFYKVVPPKSEINESWRLLAELGKTKERLSNLKTFEDFSQALTEESPFFVGIGEIAPPADFKMNGMKIAREPHRYSGRTAMKANLNVHEQTPPVDLDAPMTFTMEGYQGEPPSSLIPFYWSPGWNSAQAINKYQIEVGGPLHGGDPGKRLIEPSEKGMSYFNVANIDPVRKQHEWLTVPMYHIFGSEELSSKSSAIMVRISPLFMVLNPKDASALNLGEGDEKVIVLDGQNLNMKVKIINEMESGMVGLPAGFPSMPYWEPGILTITS